MTSHVLIQCANTWVQLSRKSKRLGEFVQVALWWIDFRHIWRQTISNFALHRTFWFFSFLKYESQNPERISSHLQLLAPNFLISLPICSWTTHISENRHEGASKYDERLFGNEKNFTKSQYRYFHRDISSRHHWMRLLYS